MDSIFRISYTEINFMALWGGVRVLYINYSLNDCVFVYFKLEQVNFYFDDVLVGIISVIKINTKRLVTFINLSDMLIGI